jgi:molecular chaperone GrpE
MWPWKKSGPKPDQPGQQGPQRTHDGSNDMPEGTEHSDMTDHDQQPEGIEHEGDELSSRTAHLEAELEEAKNRTLRLMADFQNYQRRALQNEVVAKQQGVASVASTLTTVVDHFDTALAQTGTTASPEQILAGLKLIRDELVKGLAQHGVTPINPSPNEVFEPGRHEAVMQQKAEGVEPGHVVTTFQAGYALAGSGGVPERVLRPAKVVVAPTE